MGGRARFGQRRVGNGTARTQRMRLRVSGVKVIHEVFAVRPALPRHALEVCLIKTCETVCVRTCSSQLLMSSPHSSTRNRPPALMDGAVKFPNEARCIMSCMCISGKSRAGSKHGKRWHVHSNSCSQQLQLTVMVFKSPLGKDTMLLRKLVVNAKPLRASAARRERAMSDSASAATSALRRREVRGGV